MIRWFLLLPLILIGADYDCVVVGTSPFSLFEALYQSQLGKRVLIVEESDRCGGAWKGIDICGIKNVDLGCHYVGANLDLKQFIEDYGGCKTVSVDDPELSFKPSSDSNEWYFAHGCSELIERLLKLIEGADIVLMTETKLESAFLDYERKVAFLNTSRGVFTTEKVILTPMSTVSFDTAESPHRAKTKYYHLYLLIQDPTPYRFTYRQGLGLKCSRLMNLTPFVDFTGSGRQLIVVQTYNEKDLEEDHLEIIKRKGLVDQGAYLLEKERYIYESGTLNQSQVPSSDMVEILQTGHFNNLKSYIPKWKTALKQYND